MNQLAFSIKLLAALLLMAFLGQSEAAGQIVRDTPKGGNQVASLPEILVNKLKATRVDQQAFIVAVSQQTEAGNFEKGFVLAAMRYAIEKNPRFPFPYFERVVRFEGNKRRITLPNVEIILSTRDPRRR